MIKFVNSIGDGALNNFVHKLHLIRDILHFNHIIEFS